VPNKRILSPPVVVIPALKETRLGRDALLGRAMTYAVQPYEEWELVGT
jgi:hypothetical protein